MPGAVQDALLQHVILCRRIVPQPLRTSLQQSYASRCSKSPSQRQWVIAATAENAEDTLEATGETSSSLWRRASQIGSALGLCLAAGLFCTIRPASAAEQRQDPSVSTAESSHWLSDAERLAQAAERSGNVCSTSQGSLPGPRRWHDTGIQLAGVLSKDKGEQVTDMTASEAMKYYNKEFGNDPLYGDLFPKEKKGKKFNTMESQAIDPNDWDHPEFRPMTAWRVDRMKDMTYTQLWFLIREHQVDKVKFSRDYKTVSITTKSTAPGGKRTERVGLPYDPDFYHHMVSHGVQVEIPEPNQNLDSILYAIFYLLWPIFFACFLFIFVLQIQFSPGEPSDEERLFQGAKLDKLDKSQHKLTFADIAGIDNVKAEVQELVEFLKNPRRFLDLGANSPAGVMLVGAPGTGKTLLAKAIAGEAGVRFLSVAGTEFDQMYVGVGASRVRDMFRQARESSPCILFIDEFDGIGKQRSLSAQDESANTINSLLTEMDGFEDNSGVIVMAATNRPAALDSALTRPGRFDRVIEMPLPNIDGREEILKVHSRNKRMAAEVDYNMVARATAGYSGAQLMNVMNISGIEATRRGANFITTEDMLNAIESIEEEEYGAGGGGLADADEAPPLSLRRQIAVYEGARALVGSITPHFDEVAKVACCPGGSPTGYVKFLPNEEQLESSIITRAAMEARMVVSMAGRAAEKLVLGESNVSTAGVQDIEQANLIAYEMILKYGFSKRLGPLALMVGTTGYLGENSQSISDMGPDLSSTALVDVQELLEAAEAKASFGLVSNWSGLNKIVDHLVEHETLSGTQLAELLHQNEGMFFPDPFVEGFGFNDDREIVFPGSEEVKEKAAAQAEAEAGEAESSESEQTVLTADELEEATEKAEEVNQQELVGDVEGLEAEAEAEDLDEDNLQDETRERARAVDYNDPYQRLRRMPPYPYRIRDDYSGNPLLDDLEFRARYERDDGTDRAAEYRDKRQQANKAGLQGEGVDADDSTIDLIDQQQPLDNNGSEKSSSDK